MKAVFILCDTMNRRMLDIYNKERQNTAQMPNLNRLAKKGVVFENHWCGSAPCMPARKDLMTGRFAVNSSLSGGFHPLGEIPRYSPDKRTEGCI